LKKKSSHRRGPRVPLEVDGIQTNFCKNPVCKNFGVPASTEKQPRGRNANESRRDKYQLARGSARKVTQMICLHCGERPPVKSNQAIAEEVFRIGRYLHPLTHESSCPNNECKNHKIGISKGKQYYQAFGKTKSGSPRYRCKACHKTFSVKRATTGQKQPHKNKLIFKLLMNKSPFRRICEVADVGMPTIYNKIDFLHHQCLSFIAEREKKLLSGKQIKRVYVSVDSQEYVVNWTKRDDKRNVTLSAIGSADNQTGYVFQMSLNYDPDVDSEDVETDVIKLNDTANQYAFRKYARLWLQSDYAESVHRASKGSNESTDLNGEISSTYKQAKNRKDVEDSESVVPTQKLPHKGMQVHKDYMMYGYFFHLHKLFGGVEKVRFFLDQDSGIRAACLSAFQQEVSNRACDAFYVRINKKLTVDEKRKVLAESRKEFNIEKKAHPDITDNEIKLLLIKERLDSMTEIGHWRDKWLSHPFPNMSEPEKAICYLTDLNDYDEDHKAWLYNKASMHGIDSFFMQVRRRLSLLERPISTASRTGRTWHGYSPYNPIVIIKLLDIFRVYYNYCLAGKNKQTPAMRLGLAKGVVPLENIIYYDRNS
jgi:transposase-like protein